MTLTPGFDPVCSLAPELWFAQTGSIDDQEARRNCRACPARDACLDLALTAEQGLTAQMRFGVYGGLDPRQRAAIDRKQRKEAAA